MNNGNAIILIGSPGSGKTSIAQRLAEHDKFELFETGQILRDEIRKDSEIGKKLKSYLDSGKLAPTELVMKLMAEHINNVETEYAVFDGSPRRKEEIDPFFHTLNENNMFLLKIILFRIDQRVAIKRLSSRRVCTNCGQIFNIYYNPPVVNGVCDKCGGLLDQREDDKKDTAKRRLDEFKKHTLPVIEQLENEFPEKMLEIRAEKQLDQIFKEIWSEVNKEDLAARIH